MKTAGVIVLVVLAVGGVGAGAFFLVSQKKKPSKLPVGSLPTAPAPVIERPVRIEIPKPIFGNDPIISIPRQPTIIFNEALEMINNSPKQLPSANVIFDSKGPGRSFDAPTIIRLPAGHISPVNSIIPPQAQAGHSKPMTRPVLVSKPAPVVEHPTFTMTRPAPSRGEINTHADVPVFRPTPPPSVERTYRKEVEVSGFTTRPDTASPSKHIAPHLDFGGSSESSGGKTPSRKGFNA
jgi:hypothetical protein